MLRPSLTIVSSTLRPIECSTSATRIPSAESARLRMRRTFRLVSELLGDLQEEAHVLDAGDLETEHRQDHVGDVEDRQRRVVEERGAVHDDEVVVGDAAPRSRA